MADFVATTQSKAFWPYLQSQLSGFDSDNWDGDGASGVKPSTITRASRFFANLSGQLIQPSISVGYDGSIGLAWHRPEMNMFVNVPHSGPIDFSFSLLRHRFRYSKRLMPEDPSIKDELRPALSYLSDRDANITITLSFKKGALINTGILQSPQISITSAVAKL